MVPGAARWLPYGLLGLVAGMPVDRGARRRPLLMTTDLGRGLLLTAVPMLALTRRLTVAALMVLMVVPGLMSLLNDAAYQSFLPRLVPANLIARHMPASTRAAPGPRRPGRQSPEGLVTCPGRSPGGARRRSFLPRVRPAAAPRGGRTPASTKFRARHTRGST